MNVIFRRCLRLRFSNRFFLGRWEGLPAWEKDKWLDWKECWRGRLLLVRSIRQLIIQMWYFPTMYRHLRILSSDFSRTCANTIKWPLARWRQLQLTMSTSWRDRWWGQALRRREEKTVMSHNRCKIDQLAECSVMLWR